VFDIGIHNTELSLFYLLNPDARIEEARRGEDRPPQHFVQTLNTAVGARLAATDEIIGEIRSFRTFGEDWDGYGAAPFRPETISNAFRAFELLMQFYAPLPYVVPNTNGTVGFEWETAQGEAYLEIGRTRFSFYIKSKSQAPIFSDGEVEKLNGRSLATLIKSGLFDSDHFTKPVTAISISPPQMEAYTLPSV